MLLVTLFNMTKALLLKLPLNYAIIHGKTKLLFIQKPHSDSQTFLMLGDTIHTARGEKQSSLSPSYEC